jgi:uncharacterized Ntn-hydrolase superfamily protein
MTYSIVGRDRETGEIGGAVQSAAFSAGTVIHVEAGVGAVASQSFAERAYGPLGLELLRAGWPPDRTVTSMVVRDPQQSLRQVGVIDPSSPPAAFTGDDCIPFAGEAFGDHCAAQANMMAAEGVPEAMVGAFGATAGDLATRLMAALDAAQAAGGDFRGVQAAGIQVRTGEKGTPPWLTPVVNLRVDDHPDPLGELRRLVDLTALYRRWGDPARLMHDGDLEGAVAVARELAGAMPEQVQPRVHLALALLVAGEEGEGRALLRDLKSIDARWIVVAGHLAGMFDTGLTPEDLRSLVDE